MTGMVKNIVSTFSLPAGLRLIFAALLSVSVLCGCGNDAEVPIQKHLPDPTNQLTNDLMLEADLESMIKQDFADQYDGATIDDVIVNGYYGTYNDTVALKMDLIGSGSITLVIDQTVAGIKFVFSDGADVMKVWRDGEFYSLSQAYDQGFLTREDLEAIYISLYGQPPPDGKPEGLSAETALRIRQDYLDYARNHISPYIFSVLTIKDIWINRYYGTYNNCIIVEMDYSGHVAIVYLGETIVGETLFPSQPAIAWKGGNIYELRDAYDQDLLTNNDLREIAYYIYGFDNNLETHAGLIFQIIYAIKNTYLIAYVTPYLNEDYWNDKQFIENYKGVNDVQIENYYGSYKYFDISGKPYNDCVAVMMVSAYDVYFDEPWEETVAGVLFRYSNGNRIHLWKIGNSDELMTGILDTGRFYELQEAYDLGLLTEDDLISIAYYHESGKTISY